jgi:hypothetical protein
VNKNQFVSKKVLGFEVSLEFIYGAADFDTVTNLDQRVYFMMFYKQAVAKPTC